MINYIYIPNIICSVPNPLSYSVVLASFNWIVFFIFNKKSYTLLYMYSNLR